MGADISNIVQKHPTSIQALKGKVIAFDALNVIYQFLASIRQEDGTPLMDFKGRITAHLSGLFYRNIKLIEEGLKPIYVFDGAPPEFKQREIARRKEIKEQAEAKWRQALDYGELEEARKFAKATSKLTKEMVEESKQLLSFLTIPCITAPSEGEAQAAYLVNKGIAFASGSQDYDSLLFGSPRLIRNLSILGKRKVPRQERYISVEPEEILLKEVLSSANLTREQLIYIALLIGTDFNTGIKGVGPKTALKIVKENKTLKEIEKHVKEKYNYEFEEDPEEIFSFFLNPPIKELESITFGKLEQEKIKQLLVHTHDFSEVRVDRTLNGLENTLKEQNVQKKIHDWL